MALTDTLVKTVKPIKATGEKYSDGESMYRLVTPAENIGVSTTGTS